MDTNDTIRQIINNSLESLTSIVSMPKNELMEYEGILIGRGGIFDSIESLTFLINIDEKIGNMLGLRIELTNNVIENPSSSFSRKDLEDKIRELIQ